MYRKILLLPILVLISMSMIVSCNNGESVGGFEEIEFKIQPDLRIVDGGENATLKVNRGTDSFYNLNLSNTGGNRHLTVGSRAGWLIELDTPVSADHTYEAISLYSTFGEDYWAPVNYLLNEREIFKSKDGQITYREIQAALWALLDFTGFDLENPEMDGLPEEMVVNGEFNFNLEKVKEIVGIVESNVHSFQYDPKAVYAVIAKSADMGEFLIIEESAYAFDLVNLKDTHDMVVAWDLNDSGQIVGGNLLVDGQSGVTEMGSIFARSLNSSGQVVGTRAGQAAYWDASSGVVSLSALGGDESEANDINENGQIVGEVMSKTLLYEDEEFGDEYEYEFNGFVWNSSDDSKKIGSDGWATGINSSGHVVGTDYTVSDRGFIWDQQNGMKSLGSFYGFSSARPNAINNNNQVVGSVLVAQNPEGNMVASSRSSNALLSDAIDEIERAFKKVQAGGIYDFLHVMEMVQNSTFEREAFPWRDEMNRNLPGNLPELSQSVRGKIANAGQGNFRSEAFIWNEIDGMKNLGTLGGDWSTAWDVNEKGQVVGYSDIGNGENRAFFWDEEHGMIELPALGGNSLARSINSEGEIVGYSYDAEGNFYPVKWTVSIDL